MLNNIREKGSSHLTSALRDHCCFDMCMEASMISYIFSTLDAMVIMSMELSSSLATH